jgi:hypothetical protein
MHSFAYMRTPTFSVQVATLLVVTVGALGSAHAGSKAASLAAQEITAMFGPPRVARTAAPLTANLGTPRIAGAVIDATDTPIAAAPNPPVPEPTPGPPAPAAPPKERTLSARDVAALVAPHAPDIGRCYRSAIGDSPRTTRLELTLRISHDGAVRALRAHAPGLPAKTTRKIAACARTVLAGVAFPERRGDTTVVVPYFFHKTDAPDAGPQQSCWNPKGCA